MTTATQTTNRGFRALRHGLQRHWPDSLVVSRSTDLQDPSVVVTERNTRPAGPHAGRLRWPPTKSEANDVGDREAPGRSHDLPGACVVVETGVDPVTPRFSGRNEGISAESGGNPRRLLETKHQVDRLLRSRAPSPGRRWKIPDADKKRTSNAARRLAGAWSGERSEKPSGDARAWLSQPDPLLLPPESARHSPGS
jgi:hypothetical protein